MSQDMFTSSLSLDSESLPDVHLAPRRGPGPGNRQPIAVVISIEQLHALERARTETLAEVIERTGRV